MGGWVRAGRINGWMDAFEVVGGWIDQSISWVSGWVGGCVNGWMNGKEAGTEGGKEQK